MKFMKKLSLFVALALVVTIGGVYAAWLYPADNAAVGSATKTFTGNMTQVDTQATSKGNISVDTSTDTMKIFVDDGGSFVAKATAQGSFTVRFAPVAGVSQDIADNGIPMVLELAVAGTQTEFVDDQSHSIKIFSVRTATIDLGNGTKQSDGSFTVDVTGEQILNCLAFCEHEGVAHTVTLETLEENQQFSTALNTYTISLTIKEKS